jgi:hypothetical protein
MLLDIEVREANRGKRTAEYAVAGVVSDVGELPISNIVEGARTWWDRIGTASVDVTGGTLAFDAYADARASRKNP